MALLVQCPVVREEEQSCDMLSVTLCENGIATDLMIRHTMCSKLQGTNTVASMDRQPPSAPSPAHLQSSSSPPRSASQQTASRSCPPRATATATARWKTSCLPSTQTINMAGATHPTIKLHRIHPRPLLNRIRRQDGGLPSSCDDEHSPARPERR